MADEQASDQARPPYISFTTFVNFLDWLGDGPLPPRIVKGYWDQSLLEDTLDDQLTLDGMDGCDSGWCMT